MPKATPEPIGGAESGRWEEYGDWPAAEHDPFIEEWWGPQHDALLARLVRERKWTWWHDFSTEVEAITPSEVLTAWREKDPLCQGSWYNVLNIYAFARRRRLRIAVPKPAWKVCDVCGASFREDMIGPAELGRMSLDEIHICRECLFDTAPFAIRGGDSSMSREDMCAYLVSLAEVLGRVPPKNFGSVKTDTKRLERQRRAAVVTVLKRRPSMHRVEEVFGSWFEALIASGVLSNGTQELARGTRCLADDGHICLSIGEKTIDDVLTALGLEHEKEPPYPEGHYRGDFQVGSLIIEYFGLRGNVGYDEVAERKRSILVAHGVPLLALYAEDLMDVRRLERTLKNACSSP